MIKRTHVTGLLWTALAIISCKKNATETKPPAIPLHITAFLPVTAAMDSSLTIRGSGFSKTPSANTVSFSGKTAVVSAVTDSTLTVVVPMGAQDGKISVTIGTQKDSTAGAFTYIYTVSTFAGSTIGYVEIGRASCRERV